ncbi:hemagglutinin repeat-containing protein [uncultured Acinetobacter sp.]|uniref:two-partner secretion domain-containing protein n=1 Tax=uncultured Acinetobacter sp. TaxID=165433 RepID=UPI00258EB27E|nr:hemagglutinin repeat-containing protein [uncultured Acinetobacter sp.]
MNKNCYRVIFSQARGLFIAVAEIVKSQTKQAGQTSALTSADTVAVTVSPIHYKKLNPLNFAVIGCLGALVISLPMSTVADTQIIADKSAPTSQQATILNSANGTTQVNIQTPSAGGVSRNTYTQFDVGQEGAILNNSRNNTQTQIGGWVQGNPWLAKGEAKVILNEVNSSNPSLLKGYIEVAGKQAQVVIANPSGLVCDGCGVINADRFTLTTGQAVMNQGYLESFRVREGQVTIDGKGLNGSLTPFTDIYTRALKVNAGLYANELNTVLGQNDIQVKDQVAPKITATTGATSAPISNFALDVGQLGGMYAGKIFLVGTEQGLGVRNAGTINSTQGMLSLNANGDLVNTGNVIANKDQVQLKAQNVQNTGNVSSATSQISVESQNLDNTGLISSADELHLNQQNRLNNSGTLNAARVVIDATSLKNSGSIEQTGMQGLDLKSGSMTNLGGKIGIAKNTTGSGTGGSTGGTGSETAPSNPAQDGGSLEVATPIDTTPKTYDQGYIHVKDQLNNDQGTIIANGGVDVESQNGLDNQGGQLNLGHVKIQGERFNNDQGQLTVKQAEIQTNTLSNQSGQLISNQKLNIQTQTTNNQKGKIQSVDQLDLNVVNSLDNTEGQIASGQQLNIQADQVNNQSGLIYSEQQGIELKANQVINNTSGIIQAKTQLNLASAQLDNTSGHIQAENIQQQHTTVNNIQGSIVAGQSFISTVDQFDNHQGLIDTNNGQLTHQVLNNSGSIYADQNIKITGQHILNTGSIAAGQNIQLNTAKLQHEQAALIAAGLDRQGKLTKTGDLDITADQTALHGKSFAGQHLKVASKQQIDATNGQLQAKNIDLASVTGDISTRAATVIAEQLSLKSHDLIDNQQGTLSAQQLNLTANRLDNTQGHILHTGQDQLDLNFSQSLNNQSGEIRSNAADLNIKTTLLNNTEGQVVHAGINQLNIQTAQLNGHLGQILSNGALQFKGGTLDVSGGVTSADQIVIQANELNNTQGQLIQRGTSNPLNLVIQQQLNNQAGLIQSATATNIKAGSLNNQGGTLSSAQGQNLDVDVGGKLDNSQSGQIYAGNQAHLQVGSLDNSNQGEINAQQNLQLTSQQQINNQLGQIVANGDVQIQSQGLDNSHGQIGSLQGGLSLNSGTDTLINQSGLIQAKKDVSIQAQRINNQQGQITTQGQADVISQAEIDNLEGAIAADLDVNIRSQGLNNNKGQISSAQGNLTLNAGNGTLTNQAATIVSGKTLTLSANQLDNSNHGQINSQNNADISIVKDINNTSGVIAAKQQLTLSSQGLNNTTGQIGTVQGNLHIDAGSQLLNNQQGRIQPGQDLNLNATGIDNTQGQISSKNQLQLDSRGQLLNNRQGTLSAKNLTIDSGELNNDQGLIQAQQSIQIDTHQHNLSNTNSGAQGGILSQGNIQLNNIQTLDNQRGYLASAQQLDLQANQILNQHGTVLAAKQLNLQGTGQNQLLNNQSGQLLSMGGMTLNIDQINNNGKANTADADSHITAAGELKISTQQLDNQNTLNTDPANASIQGIDANTLNITSNVLNNQSGAIRSSANQNLNIQQLLNNQSGQISSEKQLTIQGDPLVIDNLGGQILAGTGLNLSAKSLSGDGKVLSLGNAILSLQNDYVHNANAQLQANQDLSLNTQGNITNNGTINAGNQLAFNAANINSNQNGKIESHDIRLTAQNNLNNSGLINGDNTRLQADTLNNEGTGRIYGTTLAIQANTLNNRPNSVGVAPVIASRGDLHLGVKTLNNLSNPTDYTSQALIFSAGNLYLGAALDTNDQATGQADVIHNESATIESLGDMSLSAKQINNVNKYFKTEQVEVSRKEDLEKSFSSWRTFDGELIDLKNPKEDFSKYFYSEIILETQVTQSVPAQIRAGNKMDLSGAKVFNDKSQILAGGELKITDGNYESDKTEGIRQKIATGTQQLYEVRSGKDLDQKSPFKYVDEESINLVVSQALGNQRLNQNQLSTVAVSNNQSAEQVQNSKITQQEINGLQTTKNSTQLNQTKGVDLDHLNLKDSQTQNSPQASVVDTNRQQSTTSAPSSTPQGTSKEIRTIDFSNIQVPNSALYKVNADSKAGYLIETDPAFADYKKWLSSDYMLDALGLDPALQQKRLGDGFYEQRLVQDQIANLTGYRFLEGFANDDAQYKALMNNGITFAKLYGLRPGIALTAAQTAQLTSDIVWLVEQSITLPNGTTTKALVPQVYVKARVGDLKGDGTLISGNSVNLKLDGDLINGATIAGREAVQITADNVQNLNGRIQGNQIAIETQKDLSNIGGKIIAKDTMALKVGGNLNIESTTRTSESQVGNFSASSTNLDRAAGLYIGNGSTKQFDAKEATLMLNVAGNSSLKGAQINNSNGATVINTTGNVDLGIVSVGKQETLKINDKNGYQQKQKQNVGSQISSVGSLLINGQNITGKAVDLNSQQGNIQLSAQKDIVLNNGLNQSAVSSQSQSKGSFGGKKSSTYDASSSTSIANHMSAGQNIIINSAQGNISATHLQAEAGNNIQIQAQQGNVSLLSAIDDKRESSTSSKKGVATYNNRQSGYVDQEVAQTTLKAGNTVDINAAKNIELQANDVQAGNSIYVGNTLMQRQADGSLKAADGSLMPENVTLSSIATKDEQWDEQQKGYRGIAKELIKGLSIGAASLGFIKDPVKIGESKGERSEQTLQQGTSLQANNIAVGSIGQTTLTSSDLSAKNINLSGQKVTLNAAEEQSKHSSSQGEETIQGLGVKLNKDSLRLGGFKSEDTTQSTTTTITTHKSGQINTENLNIQGAEGIDILGQNVKATGDTVLDHGRGEFNIGGYENKTETEDKTHTETVTSEVGVRNAYVDAALAVGAVKDAAEAVKQAKDQYSQAQKDYAAGKITKESLDDSKANIAMATANLASAQVAVGSAAAAAAASTVTYGFTIGANGERIETTSTSTTTQGQWQGSTLDLNNLTLKSEGQNTNIQGSRLTATGTTTFDGTKDLNITAGKEHSSQSSNSKTNSQSVSYTYGGGGSASIGKQTSTSESRSLNNINSEVSLNKTEGRLNSLNIKGGEVSIQDRGNLQVNNIHVESLQDTASSSNSNRGGSIGGGYGSGSKNISASYNQSKGSSDSAWTNTTSKLLIGNAQKDANLDAMGVKNITNIGGVIANASKNADGSLIDHKNLNYTGNLELKDLQDRNDNKSRGFNVSTNIGIPQGGSKAASTAPKGSTTIGLNSSGQETEQLTKATMGQGTLTNVTSNTNRDINNTQEITRNQTTGMLNGSVTVDHRLLSESGRAEIVKEQKDLPENFRQSTENLAKALPEGAYKDKALQTLNNVQAKLYNLPSEYKEVGVVGNSVASELLKRGMESKDVEALFSKLDFFYAAKEFSEIQNQLTDLEKSGINLETIFKQPKAGVNEQETIYAQGTDFETKVRSQTTLGMTILSNIADLGNSINDISESTGVDIEKVQLAVGLLISGPVRLVIESGKSMAVDSVVGEKVAQGVDILANSMTAAAHDTSIDTINNWMNPDKISELENSTGENKDASLKFANEIQKDKQGAEYLINAASGIVVGGIAKGTVKNNNSDIDISKSGFEIGNINPITGHKILGTHKDESNNTVGDYIVEGTKPSTKDKVIKTDIQYYENPGHHDLNEGNMPYNSTKAIIPSNHVNLWENSIKVDSDPKNRWAIENKDGTTIYHRFQDDGNGNYHWNGSTKGQTSSGSERNIRISDVPSDLIKMADGK